MTHPTVQRFDVRSPDEDSFLESLAPRIERGGLFISSPQPSPEGTRVALEFSLPDQTKVFACEGTVVFSRPAGSNEQPCMVVRFDVLSPENLARVERALSFAEGTQDACLPVSAPSELALPRQTTPSATGQGADPVIGIDLGATCCRAGVLVDRDVRALELEGRNPVLPTAVAFDDRGRMLLGTRARTQQALDPASALLGIKRLLGLRAASPQARSLAESVHFDVCADAHGDAAVRVRGQVLTVLELVARLFSEVRQRVSDALGRPAHSAILSVPVQFDDRQRQALRAAAHLGGWKVEQLLADPVAASVAYCHRRGLGPKHLLVFDVGGSGFEASLVKVTAERLEVVGAVCAPKLGGNDFDRRLAQTLEADFANKHGQCIEDPLTHQRVLDAAEAAKIALTTCLKTNVHVPWALGGTDDDAPRDLDVVVRREYLHSILGEFAGRAVGMAQSLCRAQGVDPKDVEEVILAGGQSGAPLLRVPLEAAFGSKVGREIPAAEAVVNGLAVAGWALRQPERIRRSKPLTKTTLSAGLSVALEGERLAPVLPRGAPLPCETAFRLAVGDSGVLRIAVHQGDSELLGEGQYLGGIRLRAQPNTEVQVTFSLSRQAVLEVSAHAEKTSAFASLATADCTPETRSEIAATALLPVLGGVHEGVNARRLLAR